MNSIRKLFSNSLTRASWTKSNCVTRPFSSKSHTAGDPFEWDSEIHWRDYFSLEADMGVNTQLTEEERMVMDNARKVAQTQLKPYLKEGFRTESFNKDLFKIMGDAGLFGPYLEGYGCAGVSYTAYGLISREVEKIDSAYRSMFSVQSSLVMLPIFLFASEELKKKLLPGLASGELIGAFGLTEPNHGSDPSGMETTARLDKATNEWVLNGSKTWISNSPIADVFVVWAKCSDEKIRGFVIERGAHGLETPKIEGKFSLRASPTGMIMLDECRVPAGNVFENITGLKGPFTCLNSARLGIAWGALGAAESCIEAAREYTMNRKQFNKPLASNQLIQKKLADGVTEISIALQAVLRATRLKEEGQLHSNVISMLKRNSCRKSLQIARDCRDMMGGNGIVDEYDVIRHVLNLEAVNTYEGTEDVHALIVGRAITGIPAFK